MQKKFSRSSEKFRSLAVGFGSCMATDQITVGERKIGYMYREKPNDLTDSGWRFFAGDESDEYVSNPKNIEVYDLNTIANYDPQITSRLGEPIGSAWIRRGDTFVRDDR